MESSGLAARRPGEAGGRAGVGLHPPAVVADGASGCCRMAAPPAPDLLVPTGGVSVGRHDHLRPALEACGVREVLYGVEIRPGHAMRLGRRGPQLVLGLPGNPSRRRSASTPSGGRCWAGGTPGRIGCRWPRATRSDDAHRADPLRRGRGRFAAAPAPGLARDHLPRRGDPPGRHRGRPERGRRRGAGADGLAGLRALARPLAAGGHPGAPSAGVAQLLRAAAL
jgi:hypothetical protein